MEGSMNDFCYWVLDLDKGIRFAGLASSSGKLVGSAYRRGLKPLATKEESEASVLNSFTKMNTRTAMEAKFGETVYAYALYKNVKRATIPIRESSKITHIFMASFDTNVEHEPIILNKIIPRISSLFS